MDRLWQILLRSVEDDGPLSCDDCLVLLDYLSDLLASNYPSRELLALADRYLQRCPNCQLVLQQALDELAALDRQPGHSKEIRAQTGAQ
jgi:hypothetical protein